MQHQHLRSGHGLAEGMQNAEACMSVKETPFRSDRNRLHISSACTDTQMSLHLASLFILWLRMLEKY